LGKTGVEVSVLILGGVAAMKNAPTAKFHPAELANAALDAGINYFDTVLTTFNPTMRRRPYQELVLGRPRNATAQQKRT